MADENFTIYLSPLEPSTIEESSISSLEGEYVDPEENTDLSGITWITGGIQSLLTISPPVIQETEFLSYEYEEYEINLLPEYILLADVVFDLKLRDTSEYSMFKVFREDILQDSIKWEKAFYNTTGYAGSPIQKSLPGIFIHMKFPTDSIEGYPYWVYSSIRAYNPSIVLSRDTMLTVQRKDIVLGEIQDEKWIYKLNSDKIYQDTQPSVNPGEYLQLHINLKCGEQYFFVNIQVKFETPLLTGGWIVSKEEGATPEETTYTVNIFGQEISGVLPTDYYDYTSGSPSDRWVFLMKMNASFDDGQDQFFGSDNVEIGEGSDYRIVPFNIAGLTSIFCAVPTDKAIFLTPSLDYDNFFNMRHYQGTIVSVDYDNDTAEVDIPGASIHTLPVFYYCQDAEDIVKGSSAFHAEDECIIENVKYGSWEDAYIIGFPGEIKACEFYIRIQCNGITPTFPKTVRLWYTDVNGEAATQTQTSSEEEPDLCGPFVGVSFPATVGLLNSGVPDEALHPDQTSKRLFHFWQEVDPVEYPSAKYIVSEVVDSGRYVNGEMTQDIINRSRTTEPPSPQSYVAVVPVNAKKLAEELTGPPSPSTVFNFDGLKILQRRTTFDIGRYSDPALCSCDFPYPDLPLVPDPNMSPTSFIQPVYYADEELFYDRDHEWYMLDGLTWGTCDESNWQDQAQVLGIIFYKGTGLNSRSLVILTDENGNNPVHVDESWTHGFDGEIQRWDDSTATIVCQTVYDEIPAVTYALEMIDTPIDRI